MATKRRVGSIAIRHRRRLDLQYGLHSCLALGLCLCLSLCLSGCGAGGVLAGLGIADSTKKPDPTDTPALITELNVLPHRLAQRIRDAELTIWFSVPSTAVLLSRLGKLKPDTYPGLRLALFCGEALPQEILEAWSLAAPKAVLENLYGPTEVTIACTAYRWDPMRSPGECELGLVPIGEPYPGMSALVADEALREVAPGEAGELLMGGPQVSLGYWQDPERTATAFVRPPDRDAVFYRTGDRVRRVRPGGPLVYLGRVDNQIKIQGYRVELEEVESVLRDAAGVEVAIAVGWPVNAAGADGIVAFLGAESADLDAVRQRLRQRLPPYMVPRELRLHPVFELNANGKVDRKALRRLLEEGS